MTSIKQCKDCPYYKAYYQGTERKPIITSFCFWFLVENPDPNKCSKKGGDE